MQAVGMERVGMQAPAKRTRRITVRVNALEGSRLHAPAACNRLLRFQILALSPFSKDGEMQNG
jgi:hypothetical protein